MIKFNKPKFWDNKNFSFFSIFLLPFSILTLLYILLKKKLSKIKSYKIPIICVGNIYIGGTGKTPSSILIANELSNIGYKPVIVRKFYKDHFDEYNQIKNNFKNLIINKSRDKGIIQAEEEGYNTVILDDGMQDYRIKKNLSIICFNQHQLVGNGMLLPAGPLREKIHSLKNTDIILINGKKEKKFEKKILGINKNLQIFYSYYDPVNINEFADHKLFALAGIANPENFFTLLEENNLNISKKLVFPDHYRFKKNELQNIIYIAKQKKLKIIMTEKDYFKLSNFNFNEFNYLKVNLEINNKKELIDRIRKIYD